MSWENYSLMKCKKCGKVYEVEESTLFISDSDYDKCPICHSEGEEISNRSMLDGYLATNIEQLRNILNDLLNKIQNGSDGTDSELADITKSIHF